MSSSSALLSPKDQKRKETEPSSKRGLRAISLYQPLQQKMGSNAFFFFFISSLLYFFLLITLASSSPFLSDGIFELGVSTGRSLLQTKKACEVNFQDQNYTVLTSQCKAPHYPPKVCCEAFKQFACTYSDEINDMTTNCASVMFSYINKYGNYPPGLFSTLCKEGKEGLDCSQVKVANSSATSSSGQVAASQSILLITTAGFLVFLFHLF